MPFLIVLLAAILFYKNKQQTLQLQLTNASLEKTNSLEMPSQGVTTITTVTTTEGQLIGNPVNYDDATTMPVVVTDTFDYAEYYRSLTQP